MALNHEFQDRVLGGLLALLACQYLACLLALRARAPGFMSSNVTMPLAMFQLAQ